MSADIVGIVTVGRRIDDGQPLLLEGPSEGLGQDVDGVAVSTLVCENPDCSCTQMNLLVHALRVDEDGIGHGDGPVLAGSVSKGGDDLMLDGAREGAFTDAAVEWIGQRLSDPELRHGSPSAGGACARASAIRPTPPA